MLPLVAHLAESIIKIHKFKKKKSGRNAGVYQ